MNEIEVIGGAADKTKIRTAPKIVISMKLEGDSYIALNFDHEGEKHFIYGWTGMSPADAIKTWKERHRG